MNNRNFTPPHLYSESIITRYMETLMHLTYEHPVLMKDLIYIVGATSLSLIASPWVLPALGFAAPLSTLTASVIGGTGLLTAFSNGFAQQRIFGFPLTKEDEHFYIQSEYEYKTAHAELVLTNSDLPKLSIKADNYFDAGYVEGTILASAIESNLKDTDFLYPAMRAFFGAPNNNEDLKNYLNKVLKTIPEQYQQEMLGKVEGYNDWLAFKNHKNTEKLTFERYLLLQLLPDFYNYRPFIKEDSVRNWFLDKLGCTTFALRLGDYTFLTRVLDWPAHGVAGKSFLQVERKIGHSPRTVDIGLPLLSGAATILNESGLLIEINISPGDKVFEPKGMPAFFFNRYCSENATTVKDIENLIQDKQPLSAYHLTATDGCDTESFHFYENKTVLVKNLESDKSSPQILVVANNGIKAHKFEEINYCDSNQRKNNIHQFFNHHNKLGTFTPYMEKQKNSELTKSDILELKELLLQIARLPLVNNCESVLCAMYVYHRDHLIDALAATDNLYAPNKELNDFKRLSF